MSALDSILRESFQKFLRFSDDLHEMNNYLSDIRTCFLALTLAVYVVLIFYIISLCYQRLRPSGQSHQSGIATTNDRQYTPNKSDEEAMIIDKWTAVSTQNRFSDNRSPGYGYHNTIRTRSTVNPPMDLHSSGGLDRYHHHHHQPSTAKMLANRSAAAAAAAKEAAAALPPPPPAVVVSSASPQSSPSTPPLQMTAGGGLTRNADSPPLIINNKENGELVSMMVNVDQAY